MAFQKSRCVIRKLNCGNGKKPTDTAAKKYSRKGTQYECLKKGYGVADWAHRKKGLSKFSLQQIPYIGDVLEANFKRKKIYSIKSLTTKMRPLSAADKKKMLLQACKRKNNSVDYRALNSVLLFLHGRGVKTLPNCKVVSE